jgi:hypothetical protein
MLLSWWAEASTPGTDTSTECHSRRSIAVHMAAANSAAMVERSAALCSIQVGPRVLWNMNHPITHGTQATRGGPRASHFRHSLVVSLNSPGQNKAGLPHGFMSVPAPSHFGARSTVRDPTYIFFVATPPRPRGGNGYRTVPPEPWRCHPYVVRLERWQRLVPERR